MIFFIVPHAGGTAREFYGLRDALSPFSHVRIFELKGHGVRLEEGQYSSYGEAVDEFFAYLVSVLEEEKDTDYALCGNSMGAYIISSVIKRISDENIKAPRHVFYCACCPSIKSGTITRETLEEDCEDLARLKGSRYYDLCVLPSLENDLKILGEATDTFKVKASCDITAMCGKEDSLAEEFLSYPWDKLTEKKAHKFILNGDHLFLYKNSGALDIIKSRIGIARDK